MTVADFPGLRDDRGRRDAAALAALSDDAIAQALLDGGFGIQRIASQILLVPPDGAGAPLDRVFLFFGQRFVIDSEVFSDVVFDRVRGEPKRMMPNPLDVAFAALGNNAAAPLLASELAKYPNYPGALARRAPAGRPARRRLLGRQPLHRLAGRAARAVRSRAAIRPAPPGLPAVDEDRTVGAPGAEHAARARGRSCATTRCSTPSSRTPAIPTCDFPDAYVDPYPEAWAGIVRLARLGQTIAAALPAEHGLTDVGPYFAQVRDHRVDAGRDGRGTSGRDSR